jgi:transcriptional regulator with XRE-family HTH domain
VNAVGDLKKFGRALADARAAVGFSAQQLSERLPLGVRVTSSAIRSYENGRHKPSQPVARAIEKVLVAAHSEQDLVMWPGSLLVLLGIEPTAAERSAMAGGRQATLDEISALKHRLSLLEASLSRDISGEPTQGRVV